MRITRYAATAAVAGLILAVLILFDLGGPVLAPVTIFGCLVLPGWVLVRRIPDGDPAARVVWTVVMSAAIYTIPALLMAWAQVWHPRPVTAAILVVASTLIALFPPGTRTGRPPTTSSATPRRCWPGSPAPAAPRTSG